MWGIMITVGPRNQKHTATGASKPQVNTFNTFTWF